jgi:hypothetical protein
MAQGLQDVKEGKDFHFPTEEEDILKLWKELDAFKEQLRRTEGKPEFSFYDGPPFATGLPHYGHLLAGTLKVRAAAMLLPVCAAAHGAHAVGGRRRQQAAETDAVAALAICGHPARQQDMKPPVLQISLPACARLPACRTL